MRTLGKGSFGTVYEGMTTDGRLVAVKVQEVPEDSEEAKELKAVQDEINVMRSLEHHRIVTYYGCQTKHTDTGTTEMEIFLELCHGGSLAALRKRFAKAKEPFAMTLVRTYTRQILEGLAYLHRRKVVHRDLKSDNVLIAAGGEAKLSDFGCSKRSNTVSLGNGGGGGGASGGGCSALYHTMVGSPLFMAPEVMNATAESGGYTMSADIWSLGCLVLELLGRTPWSMKEGDGMNVFKLLFHISKSVGMPTGVPKKCPARLQDFFTCVFDRDPERRWSAEQLLTHPWITCPDEELEELPPQEDEDD